MHPLFGIRHRIANLEAPPYWWQNGQAVSVKSDVSTLQKPTGVALGSGIVGILVEIYLLYKWVNYIYGGIIYIYTYGWNRWDKTLSVLVKFDMGQ